MILRQHIKTPQQRFMLCVALACIVHALGLVTLQQSQQHPAAQHQKIIDILLTPPLKTSNMDRAKYVVDAKKNDLSLAKLDGNSPHIKPKTKEELRKRTISMAHHQPQDADYLSRWQAYIEDIGSRHVVSQNQHQNLSGSLRLMVAVNKDGSLREVNLRKSSGVEALDKAAIKIVTMAAPFEPLPSEISKEVDVLEIIRTWQFNQLNTAKS